MYGMMRFLADEIEFNGIGGRCWDWWTLLRWVEFVMFWAVFLETLKFILTTFRQWGLNDGNAQGWPK